MHFYQALQRNATILPNTIGTSFADREHTWNEVNNRVAKSASGLAAIGAGKGIHIAILALNSDKYFESIEYISSESKGSLLESGFHVTGLAKAKSNTESLRADYDQNINSIKIEAELSLEKLNNIPKNSKDEMDIYVGNYNSNL